MENNIKMYPKDVKCGNVHCIHLALDKEEWGAVLRTMNRLLL